MALLDPGEAFDELLEQFTSHLQVADEKASKIAQTFQNLQDSIEADQSTVGIAINLAGKHDDEIQKLKTRLANVLDQHRMDSTNTINQYHDTIQTHNEAIEAYNAARQACLALQGQDELITRIDGTLNRLTGVVINSQGIVTTQAMINHGENINLRLENRDLKADIERLTEDANRLEAESKAWQEDSKKQREIAEQRGEALRSAKVSDPSAPVLSTQAATRKGSLMSLRDILAMGPSKEATPSTSLEKGGTIRNIKKIFGRGQHPAPAVVGTTEQDPQQSVPPTVSPPRTTPPLTGLRGTAPALSRFGAASPLPILGSAEPPRPATAQSYLSGGMLSGPSRPLTPDPNIPLFDSSNPLRDPRRALVYSPSRQGNGIGVYRGVDAAQSMPDITDPRKRPAPAGESPARRGRPRLGSRESCSGLDVGVLDVPRQRGRVEHTEDLAGMAESARPSWMGGVPKDNAGMEQARREGVAPPRRLPGERYWEGPPADGPNSIGVARNIYNAVHKPANWDSQANDALNAILTSGRSFGAIVEDFHNAPRCLASRVARKPNKVSDNQTTPCEFCQGKTPPVPCFGLKRLGDVVDPQTKYNGKLPRMDFERNADGHYWEAVYRPRGPGGDDDEGGQGGGQGCISAA